MIQFKTLISLVMSMIVLTGCTVSGGKGALQFNSFYESLEHKVTICKEAQASMGNHLDGFLINDGTLGRPNRLNHSYNMDGFLIEILNFDFEYTGPGMRMDGGSNVGCLFEKGTDHVISAWYHYGPLKKGEVVSKVTPLTDPDPKVVQKQWESIIEKGIRAYSYVLDADLNLGRQN